jgi:hypothetical protein
MTSYPILLCGRRLLKGRGFDWRCALLYVDGGVLGGEVRVVKIIKDKWAGLRLLDLGEGEITSTGWLSLYLNLILSFDILSQ